MDHVNGDGDDAEPIAADIPDRVSEGNDRPVYHPSDRILTGGKSSRADGIFKIFSVGKRHLPFDRHGRCPDDPGFVRYGNIGILRILFDKRGKKGINGGGIPGLHLRKEAECRCELLYACRQIILFIGDDVGDFQTLPLGVLDRRIAFRDSRIKDQTYGREGQQGSQHHQMNTNRP